MDKKKLKALLDRVEGELIACGFEKKEQSGYTFQKETKYGLLLCRPDDDRESKLYSIFCKFENVDKAQEILKTGGNAYSGKRNFHEKEVEVLLFKFLSFLDAVNSNFFDEEGWNALDEEEGGGSYCCGKRMVEMGTTFTCLKCGGWGYSSS